MDSSRVTRLLDKMKSPDKDFRYMALSDLTHQIGTFLFSEEQTIQMVKQLLTMISDKNTEVQNLAVKCFGKILTNMSNSGINLSVKSCCNIVKDRENKEAEMYAAALKEVVPYLKKNTVVYKELITKEIIPCVLDSCGPEFADGVRFECLDILADVLLRHGSTISAEHPKIKAVIDCRVKDKNYSIVKRANNVMGNLMMFCHEELYHTIVNETVIGVGCSSESIQKTRIGTLVLAAKAKPVFFNSHIPTVVELLLSQLSKADDDEVMETILQACDVFIQKCPAPIEPFVPQLKKALLKAMVHDPNYDGGIGGEEESSEKEEYDSDYVYSDDDDMDLSWKVRRAAAKALQSLIEHQRGMPSIVESVAPLLVTRFRDRDEGVSCEVMATYAALVRCVRKLKETDMASYLSAVENLRRDLIIVIKAMDRPLCNKSSHISTAYFDVLTEYTRTLNNCFASHMDVVFDIVSTPISEVGGNPQLKLVALRFFFDILESHERPQLMDHVTKFATVLTKAIADTKFYKVSSEAVMVSEKFCDFMQMKCDDSSIFALLEAVEKYQASQPFDQDARDHCISCIGKIISGFGEILGEKAYTASVTLLEHAQPTHGSCRVAINALTNVAKSSSKNVLEREAARLVDVCNDHFKTEAREFKMVAIKLFESALENGVLTSVDSIDKAGDAVVHVMAMGASDDALFTQAAVRCLSAAHLHLPSEVLPTWDNTLRMVTSLLVSSTNPGSMLDSITDLIRSMANTSSFKDAPFESLIDTISCPVFNHIPLNRANVYATAVVVAEMTRTRNQLSKAQQLVSRTALHLSSDSADTASLCFCVSLLGEIGRRFPECYRDNGNKFEYCTLVTKWLDSPVDDVRASACQALGAFAVGDAAQYLSFIMQQVQQQPQLCCYLLNSIKEIVRGFDSPFNSVTKSQAADIWALLESFMDCQDEGMRLVVAECLGRSCVFNPDSLFSLLTFVCDPRPLIRHCALYAFRQIINMQANVLDTFLVDENFGKLLSSLTDDDILPRRSSFYVLNALIHHKFSLLRPRLPEIMPIVYDNMRVRKELITEVEMGPFKLEQDGGVEVRSAAYQVVFSILEVSPSSVILEEYVKHLKPSNNGNEQSGIKDRSHDIRMASYMMLLRLVDLFPTDLLQMSVDFVDLLKSQLEEKLKTNAVKQEAEKLGELKNMAIKFIYALNGLPGAEKFSPLKDIVAAAEHAEKALKA